MKILLKTAFIMVFLFVSAANARVLHIPIEDIPAMADFVIVAEVVDSACRWDERGVMIFTDYTLQVQENILGYTPAQIIMSFAGGTVGAKTIVVTNTPVLEIGKTYILFGHDNNKYSVPVVGHEQGVFRVVRDKIENQDFVVDYHWRRLEINNEEKILKGPMMKQDESGALSIQAIADKPESKAALAPIVRNMSGQEINQDNVSFEKSTLTKSGTPMTSSDFISFIRKNAGGKEVQK